MEEKPPPTEGNEKITKKLIQIFEKESDSAKKTPQKEDAEENKAESTGAEYSQPGPSSRSSSPEPNCAICLETLQNKSFTDSCFHTFCFTCLVEWSKVKPECPLCKQKFKSIVHNVQKDLTFEEYHIASRNTNERAPVLEVFSERFRYRTTQMHRIAAVRSVMADMMMSHRMQYAPHTVIVPSSSSSTSPLQFQRGTLEFRRRVYAEGLWVKRPSLRQVRAASPDFFRRSPACTHRLLPWLQRELEALLGPYRRGDSTRLMNAILSELPRTNLHSAEFADTVRHHLGPRTSHFLHEFLNFAASPVSMETYDLTAEYSLLPSTHPAQPLIIPGEDDEVRQLFPDSAEGRGGGDGALDMSFRPPRAKRMPFKLYMERCKNGWRIPPTHNRPASPPRDVSAPGPSSVFALSSFRPPPPPLVSSDDEECRVVGVVKPRSERTPEIVDLSSDDEVGAAVIDISSDNDDSISRTYTRNDSPYPTYSPKTPSPCYSPTSPYRTYSPISPRPHYSPTSPRTYSPISPRYHNSPTSPYLPSSTNFSPASPDHSKYVRSSLISPDSPPTSSVYLLNTSNSSPSSHSNRFTPLPYSPPHYCVFGPSSKDSPYFSNHSSPPSVVRNSPPVWVSSDSDVECVYQGKQEPGSPPPVLSSETPTSGSATSTLSALTSSRVSSSTSGASTSHASTPSVPREEKRPKLASAIVMPKKRSKTSRHSYRFSDSDDASTVDYDSGDKKPKKVKKHKLSSVGVVPSSHRTETSHRRESDSSSLRSEYKMTVSFKKHKKKKHKDKKKHVHKHKRRLLSDSDSG